VVLGAEAPIVAKKKNGGLLAAKSKNYRSWQQIVKRAYVEIEDSDLFSLLPCFEISVCLVLQFYLGQFDYSCPIPTRQP